MAEHHDTTRAAPSEADPSGYKTPKLWDLLNPHGGWVGVDLDGTLAEYHGWQGEEHIGPAIDPMVLRVRDLLYRGIEVRVVTARVDHLHTRQEILDATKRIQIWCFENIGMSLPVTASKDRQMSVLFDDRAVRVVSNIGMIAEVEEM